MTYLLRVREARRRYQKQQQKQEVMSYVKRRHGKYNQRKLYQRSHLIFFLLGPEGTES